MLMNRKRYLKKKRNGKELSAGEVVHDIPNGSGSKHNQGRSRE